ncbi:hypothetical protein G7K_1590-t1 [Saitoella complicata NRRL Y-17804]|uniref:Retrotransposon gag domain-containing protein n=1 Tax=Saitoella complicata (strain BCRC 22490 / CBS 7301 / JCM 7358 / NBRC 10748 / NRRL Y-17804) TaxID=698492 RepID=A0A0E9NC03_SAICN|nr:hypothetical protein G7K_1590-t1 [Saitoella complicata NRRL Y-17804]
MATPRGLKLKLPESYNGKRDLMVIENWCFSVDQYLSLAEDIRAGKHSAFVGTLLTGNALSWYRAQLRAWEVKGKDPAALTWDSIKRGLMKYFAPVNAARSLRDEGHSSRQTTSVGEYVTQLTTYASTSWNSATSNFSTNSSMVEAKEGPMLAMRAVELEQKDMAEGAIENTEDIEIVTPAPGTAPNIPIVDHMLRKSDTLPLFGEESDPEAEHPIEIDIIGRTGFKKAVWSLTSEEVMVMFLVETPSEKIKSKPKEGSPNFIMRDFGDVFSQIYQPESQWIDMWFLTSTKSRELHHTTEAYTGCPNQSWMNYMPRYKVCPKTAKYNHLIVTVFLGLMKSQTDFMVPVGFQRLT